MLLVKLLFAVIEPVLTPPPSPPVLLWQHIGLILLERHVNKNKTKQHSMNYTDANVHIKTLAPPATEKQEE